VVSGERLERRAAVAALLAERGELVVVTGLGSPSYDVMAAGDHDLNYYLWGAMGSAATVGAEALAQACANLERAAKSGALADTAMLLARIEDEWERLCSQLPDYQVAKAA